MTNKKHVMYWNNYQYFYNNLLKNRSKIHSYEKIILEQKDM
jgi:5-bromo-4-chloroindolyl phosphate hydrolysis protein